MRLGRDWNQRVAAFRTLFADGTSEWNSEALALFDAIGAEPIASRKVEIIAAHLATACDEGYEIAEARRETDQNDGDL